WVEPPARMADKRIARTALATAAPGPPLEVNGSIGPALLPGAPAVVPSQKDRILTMLMAELQELSGANLAGLVPSATFTEMGFDSLFLAQSSQVVERKFGV